MTDTLILNAFQLVRPQAAVEAPSKAPRKAYHASVWMAAYAVSINPQEAA